MPETMTREQTRQNNQALYGKLTSGDPMSKQAAVDAVGDYTRYKIREDGVARRILPPQTITASDLQRSITSPRPVVIVDREPDSPAAVAASFHNNPDMWYMQGERYEVTIARLLTNGWIADVSDLATWTMDIRQILSDNSIKELMTLEDTQWFEMCNDIMVSQGAVVPLSGIAQWQSIPGMISRDSFIDGKKILPSTPSNLPAKVICLNNLTYLEFEKFDRQEAGGNLSEELLRQGMTAREFSNMTWVVTIKRSLVPTMSAFYFADPAFMGKFYEYVQPTMAIEHRYWLLSFFTYEEIGFTIANTNSIARADFE